MKRGHSNIHVEQLRPWENNPKDQALIPMEGGSTVFSVKELPPLSLKRDEWEEIGKQMGWLENAKS